MNEISIYQIINSPGVAGDTFVFGGYCFYENYTGDVSVTFNIITENGGVSKTFTFVKKCDIILWW